MKKALLIISIFLIFLSGNNVYAFEGSYNYEVTSLVKDDEGNITVKGWGIPNAGVNDGQSPSLNKNRGSGSSGSCTTNNPNNYYTYTLYAVPLDENKKTIDSKALEIGSKRGSGTSVTGTLCYKNDSGRCVAGRSSCYENVGFSFSFNEKITRTPDFKNGYILRMKLIPSGDPNAAVTFNLVVYSSNIKGFGSEYEYRNDNRAGQNLRVQVIAHDGYFRNCNSSGCYRKSGRNKFPTWTIYNVLGLASDGGQTYYKVANQVYIPASWVAPPQTDLLILPPSGPKDVKSCSDNTTSQVPSSKVISSCGGNASFEGENYNACSVDEYSYYTKKCYETDYKVDFNINETSNKSFSITNGSGITATANLSTKFGCSYTFDIEKFKSDYNDVLYNLDFFEAESPDWYINYKIKENLDNILKNYNNQTNSVDVWNSNYDVKKIEANLKLDNKTVAKLENTELVHSDKEGTKDGNKYCSINKTEAFRLSNGTNINLNSDVTCGEGWSLKMELPRVCLSMKTGKIENCLLDSNNQIDGGKKYYLDMNKESGTLSLELKNLGYDGNWSATLKDCNFSIPGLLNKQVSFRQIELTDPFLQNYDRDRGPGKNFSNNKYDFQDIIKDDIWKDEKNFMYDYLLSKVNVENIRKDTKEDMAGSYLGRNCYFRSPDKKYICEFTRDIEQEELVEQNRFFYSSNFNED